MKQWIGIPALFFFLSVQGLAFGAEPAGGSGAAKMDSVVVTASRVEETQREITINMTVIDAQEIALSPSTNLGELLAEKGLGAIKRYPGSLISLGIRGFRTETHGNDLRGHILILLDGRRAGSGNAAKFLTKNIERVEIIRGPTSVLYGSAGMGGIVNVITKRGKGDPSFFVEGTAGSHGYREFSTGISGGGAGFDFSGALTHETMDDYETGDGEDYANTGYDAQVGGSANIGYELFPGNRIGLIYTHMDVDEAGSPNYLSQVDTDDYTDKSNYSFDASYEGRTVEGLFLWKLRYFAGKDKDAWFNPVGSNPDGWDNGVPSSRETDSAGIQAQLTFDMEWWRLTTGYDWVDYQVDATWNPSRTTYENPAGFLLAKANLLDDQLILSGGLRYDRYEVSVVDPAGNTEEDSHLGPQLGLAWLPLNWLKLRAGYAEGFFMPGADQMAADYTVWGRRTLGNPNLEPETSYTTEGGFDIFYGALNASLTYFHTDFEDKIVTATLSDGSSSWENKGEATISGFEGELSYDIGTLFNWDFGLTPYVRWVYMTEYEDEETGEDLLETSDINASYGITLSGLWGIQANLNFAYFGERTVTDYESGFPYQNVELDDFTYAQFSVSKQLYRSDRYGGVTATAQLQNLFDEDFEHVKGYPMPGRGFYIGLRYDY